MITNISALIARWEQSAFASYCDQPWIATTNAKQLILGAISGLNDEYETHDDFAIHSSATVEANAILKGPIILGPNSFIAANSYLRGGVFLDDGCIIGPSCELRSTFMFRGAKVAHLSFVGDSILGENVNIEAGAIIANYRNELDEKRIKIQFDDFLIDTGVDKFGAIIGDGAKIGANAVIAPGAIVKRGYSLARLGKIDQHPTPL